MYMQGIQDYMNWWMYSIKQYFQDESPTKELLDIQKKIFNLDELVCIAMFLQLPKVITFFFSQKYLSIKGFGDSANPSFFEADGYSCKHFYISSSQTYSRP